MIFYQQFPYFLLPEAGAKANNNNNNNNNNINILNPSRTMKYVFGIYFMLFHMGVAKAQQKNNSPKKI